ncbi:SMI1/KNR4 family protein [Streptomyces sp. NPDC059003]|uniref:SMI1/KNR4 family protein n=1 Tax=Streptomyces sp. NPDC059003 TaxID=3346691 RepID=UPI00369BBA1B
MSVEESWKKIERWIAQHAPEEAPLPGPCTHADLERLHERLGVRLPEDVARSLLRHNGSGHTAVTPPGFVLYDVEQIAREHGNSPERRFGRDRYGPFDGSLIVPVGGMGDTKLVVNTRTGGMGHWGSRMPYYGPFEDPPPLWRSSFCSLLDNAGHALASPPPWFTRDDGKWQATCVWPHIPGRLIWTDNVPGGLDEWGPKGDETPVEESWENIERWLAQQAPQEDPLPEPCTRADLESLYERIGVRLPDDIERSLLRHDGSGRTDIIPPGFVLYGVEQIAQVYAGSLEYRLEDDLYGRYDSRRIVPIGALNVTKLVVNTRTGRIGEWDIEDAGYRWFEGPLWRCLASVLELVGNALVSPPPWIARTSGDEEWEATDVDLDFPGTLVWTDGDE